ncbi:protease modulator HflC [bacterium]|nr:protease modulator HflC [bacterium]
MKNFTSVILSVIGVAAFLVISGVVFVVNETEQVVITQFGEPIGEPIVNAGLHFKMPFVQQANYFEKRILEWDGNPNQIPTKDKRYIWVDTTARWRIINALEFMRSVGNEVGAHARLDDIIDSAARDAVTNNNLVEAVRNSNRIMDDKESSTEVSSEQVLGDIEKIYMGRDELTRRILEEASKIVPQYGIELVDVRIKRINYVTEVQAKVYERMISERKRAAEKYRSEGQGKKASIEGEMIKELNKITSEAYKVAEEIKGKGDAEAINIYANAYNKDPEFYAFTKTLDTYRQSIDKNTTVILGTDGEYFRYLNDIK